MLLKIRAIFIEVAAPVLLLEVLLVGGEVLQVECGGEAEGDDGDDEQRLHGDDGGLLRSTGDRDSNPSPAFIPRSDFWLGEKTSNSKNIYYIQRPASVPCSLSF